jgi:signal transduction histidine kinase
MDISPSIDRDLALISRSEAVPAILEIVARTTGMRFTAVARVTETRWTACAVYDQINFGLQPGGELVLESTICNEIRVHQQPVLFGHASEDPAFSTHPTPKLYGFESYISIPIFLSDGCFFGTLCAIDPLPVRLDDPNLLKTLELFTKLIAAQYEAEQRNDMVELALLDAQSVAKLRDQFVAVLGHDLRNPVQSVSMGADMLERDLPEGRERRIAKHIQRSCQRMMELIDNVMDFARGKLGDGISVSPERSPDLAVELEHVVSEIQRAHPDRRIELTSSLDSAFSCDGRRIAQLLSNLLSNAISHGSEKGLVRVCMTRHGSAFELSVENEGKPIEADKIERLFQPFTRGSSASPRPGLGLGLYIASEIARSHGGTLQAASDASSTRFVFRMPIDDEVLTEDQSQRANA